VNQEILLPANLRAEVERAFRAEPEEKMVPRPRRAVVLDDDIRPLAGMGAFWHQQGAWSQATFGADGERGPKGAVKHLALEVLVELLGIDKDRARAFIDTESAAEVTRDIYEYVDSQFLIFDATRRAGHTFEEFVAALWQKLDINRRRKWNVAKPGEPSEHVRDEELYVK
jgi:hypothetical protein